MAYKYGKLPARPGAIQLQLGDYLAPRALPRPPDSFGREDLINDWGVLGNRSVGNCVLAGGAHETMLWCAIGGHPVSFSDRGVISDYSAITGYNRWKPWTDRGTDIQEAAKYRQRVGLKDRWGRRHQIGAYALIRKGDIEQHKLAMYLFGAVGIGFRVPEIADKQFEEGRPWDFVPGNRLVGGHYVSGVAWHNNMIHVVTWGKLHPLTPRFLEEYEDEGIVYLSPEMLTGHQTIDGFDYKRLVSDLQQLQAK